MDCLLQRTRQRLPDRLMVDPVQAPGRERHNPLLHGLALQQGRAAVRHARRQHLLRRRRCLALSIRDRRQLARDHDEELRWRAGADNDLARLEGDVLEPVDDEVLLRRREVAEEVKIARLGHVIHKKGLDGAAAEDVLHWPKEPFQGALSQGQAGHGVHGLGAESLLLAVHEGRTPKDGAGLLDVRVAGLHASFNEDEHAGRNLACAEDLLTSAEHLHRARARKEPLLVLLHGGEGGVHLEEPHRPLHVLL
mmetsp:Transcript_22297/g.63271  ORF Transcript_22297/g.63271 Transcript_22297/m.63271 type:complete len:251 (+) Transcript_22297:615-1367(+)